MSTRPRARADVQPTSWEIPAAAAAVWLVAAALILPASQGAAAALFGGGWVWPRGSSHLMASIGGLVIGRPGRGLPAELITRIPAGAPIYVLAILAELLLTAASFSTVVLWWTHVGPGALRGMATRLEAESVLGVSALRKAREVIRPDLYGAERGSTS